MGNAPSSLSLAVKGLKDGDAADLSEESWAALLGSRDRPPLTASDVRQILSDVTLREIRARRPWNLATMISRAVERLEELIEPDVGKEHLGAAVAPHDSASLLSALRLLTRVLPFVVGCPSSSTSSSSPDGGGGEGEDQATTAARAVHEHIWGAPSRVMMKAADDVTVEAAAAEEKKKEAEDAALLANALQWRRAESVGGQEAAAAAAADDDDDITRKKDKGNNYRDANPRAAEAARLADAAVDLAGGPPPLLNLGERILALALDLLFCPGLTLPFVDPSIGGREWGAAHTEGAELATHRTEVMRLVLALVASEGLHLPPGSSSSSDPRPFLHLLATASTGVLTGHPVSHEDIFYALMGVVVSAPPESACDGTPGGEQLAAALHCLLTLLDYDPPQQQSRARRAQPLPSATLDAGGRRGGGGTMNNDKGLEVSGGTFGGFGWFGLRGESSGGESSSSSEKMMNNNGGGGGGGVNGGGLSDAPTAVLSNMYSRMLEGIHASSGNLEPLHKSLLKLIRSGLGPYYYYSSAGGSASSSLTHYVGSALWYTTGIGGGTATAACHQEAAVLTMHALRCNEDFYNIVTSPAAKSGLPLAFTLLALVMSYRDDPTKGGLLQCASFIVLRLSTSRNFAIALNSSASARAPLGAFTPDRRRDGNDDDGVPADAFELPDAFSGTHADVFIHACYVLLTEPRDDPTWVAPLVNPLLTALHNVAPYWKNVSAMGAERLIAMVEHFADPAILYSHPDAYQNLVSALHPVDRCLQHQPESNPALVYAVLRLGDVFDSLNGMGVTPLDEAELPPPQGSCSGYGSGSGSVSTAGVETGATDEGQGGGTECEGANVVGGAEAEAEAKEEVSGGAGEVGGRRGGGEEEEDEEKINKNNGGGTGSSGGGGGGGRFNPTREWLEMVRGELPLLLSLQLRRVLTPMVEDFCTAAEVVSERQVHEYITGQAIADLLPPPQPITVRRFTESPAIRAWLRGYTMGLVLLRQQTGAAAAAFAPMFDATRVRLFKVLHHRK